jgi:hypothetical protein
MMLQTEVMTMRIEVMLEEVTALAYRGNGALAEKVGVCEVPLIADI